MDNLIRDRDGSLIPADTAPVSRCICDGDGTAGLVEVDGRDVLRICTVHKPHLAGLPSVAQRSRSRARGRASRHLTVVRSTTRP
jgi:hypothetical protein